jgi:hypothetical protein
LWNGRSNGWEWREIGMGEIGDNCWENDKVFSRTGPESVCLGLSFEEYYGICHWDEIYDIIDEMRWSE